eukprot:gene7672-7146_t
MAALCAPIATAAVPHLHGIFVSPTGTVANWTSAQWDSDLAAMRQVDIEFFCLDPIARQDGPPTAECPVGTYTTLYPSSIGNSNN